MGTSAKDWLQQRRDARLGLVLRILLVAAGVGIVSTLPALLLSPSRAIGGENLLLLCGLEALYLWSFGALRAGQTDRARRILFGAWLCYPSLLLLIVPSGHEIPFAQSIMLTVSTAFTGLVIVGVVALETHERVRRWVFALLLAFLAGSVAAGWRLHSPADLLPWATLTGISLLLLCCVAAFALAFASDLYRTLDEAEMASLAKSRFLANMSHELRTPLTGIIGYVELLREETIDPQVLSDLERIWLAATHLHAIIGDVLDLTKIEADKIEMDWTEIPVHELLVQVEATVSPLAAGRGNVLTIERSDLPLSVESDPAKLRQVLLNLLGNAAKFTEDGEITLAVRSSGDRLCFEVRDTGIGIPADKHDQVFRPFEQADGSTTRKYGGTGLGLAISRTLVRRLGGELSLRSAPGEGTCFSFSLPKRRPR